MLLRTGISKYLQDINEFRKVSGWLFGCLGCPFTGLLYTCNIHNDETSLCIYWLSPKYFQFFDEERFSGRHNIDDNSYRPVGIHFKSPIREQFSKRMNDIIEECTAQASVLERLSSLAQHITWGLVSLQVSAGCLNDATVIFGHMCLWHCLGLFQQYSEEYLEESWLLRILNEKFKKHVEEHEECTICVHEDQKEHKLRKRDNPEYCYVNLTGLMSMGIPWAVVILARLTPPIGCFCRCQYLSVLASIWSTNT
ncbi:48_t:CDS:2 [Funneliformis mosseae]|uniref:48_t:CDS:1 n=1 Tax=Funneliformis mosseae TaxID=27381 RepID=A0A9N9B537_FUNMO|nr:48_t:CDS:2 [Funneliformis mosseae]